MNKIVVNPTQFITCRLCLEELGLYQIVPNVKEQILYCFGIEVQPFDGLPQLICQKCEKILETYSQIKKKFIEKQAELHTKIFTQESLSEKLTGVEKPSETSDDNHAIGRNKNRSKSLKRKARISSSSSNTDSDRAKVIQKSRRSTNSEEINPSFPTNYTKHYVCRICNSRWSNVNLVNNHINRKHRHLYRKYGHIFKRHCQVTLPKTNLGQTDNGFMDKIMYSRDKILKNVGGNYFITYTTRNYKEDDKRNGTKVYSRKTKSKYRFSSDSSEDEEIVVKHKRRKRLGSRSSNETVVLDTKTDQQSDNGQESLKTDNVPATAGFDECINLDDSSDNESEQYAKTSKTKTVISETNNDTKVDSSIICEIITSCRNKYIKKHYQESLSLKSAKNPTEIATHLKRKILSIGRKLINKKIGINCTPLVRFIENKNLDVLWNPRESVYVNWDSNYVRILTKTSHIGDNTDSETGWTDYNSTQTCDVLPSVAITARNDDSVHAQNNVNALNIIQQVPSLSMPEMAAVLEANLTGVDNKKLLNANPVANPKQLPRKTVISEIKTGSTPKPADIPPQEINDSELCMPIITSTTSLAMPFTVHDDSNKPEVTITKLDDGNPIEAPRIKVKPVSELMSAETLNRMNSPAQVPFLSTQPLFVQNNNLTLQSGNNIVNVFIPRIAVSSHSDNLLQANNSTTDLVVPEPTWQNEFMILDTVELPNKRTNSPFLYFRNLLQLHNIILLDTHAELNSEFHCLIKFKVMYKQDNRNQPVVLCLALHCYRNIFCFKVKDRNQDNIDITKITPNWQWEVLKIYKGEVVTKLLSNAQKIGPDVYEHTNKFLCLLKSINLVRKTDFSQ